ncbi:unnamed protein product [marine sediment metagenome]|uniref:Uncharacterized protein n=1 Tax=marine sediment metagenome TaxID=412755 RepID=X1S8S5_9ZZZZ
MTIDEAIKYLYLEGKGLMDYVDPKWAKAKQLGIEALKRVRDTRVCLPVSPMVLLPGESKD